MSRLTPDREAEIRPVRLNVYEHALSGREALEVWAEIDALRAEQATMLADNAAVEDETDKLRAELAELRRERDELARQAEAGAEVIRELDAELAEAKAVLKLWEAEAAKEPR